MAATRKRRKNRLLTYAESLEKSESGQALISVTSIYPALINNEVYRPVPPAELQRLLRQEIESVISKTEFDHELREQKQDVQKLKAAKAAVLTALQSIKLEGGDA